MKKNEGSGTSQQHERMPMRSKTGKRKVKRRIVTGIYGWNPGYQWRWRNRKFGSGNHSWIGELGMTHRNSITQFSLGFPNVLYAALLWQAVTGLIVSEKPRGIPNCPRICSKLSIYSRYSTVSQLACRMSTLPYRSPCRPRLPEFLHPPPIWAGCIPLR
jgi:hypothetical protein